MSVCGQAGVALVPSQINAHPTQLVPESGTSFDRRDIWRFSTLRLFGGLEHFRNRDRCASPVVGVKRSRCGQAGVPQTADGRVEVDRCADNKKVVCTPPEFYGNSAQK